MAVAFKTSLGNGLATASGTTIAITTTAAIAIGDLVVVRWASDNLNATTPTATCADGGNTYTVLRQAAVNATAAAGVAGGMLASKATVARPTSSTITVTLSGSVAHRCVIAESFTGVENTTRVAAVGATGTATAASAGATAAGIVAGDLVLGHIANETRGTITGDTDTTNGSWSTQVTHRSATSGSDATCVSVAGQYKIPNAAGAQTYNVTAVGAEWVCQCVVLQATPDPAITQAAYRWYGEGTESGATALANQDTAVTGDITNGDATGTLRIRLQSTTAVAVPATDDFQLQYEKNTSGSWINVSAVTTNVSTYDSPNLTNAAATTNRLTGGTGSFVAGKVSEDSLMDDLGWAGNNFTELVYALKVKAADVAASDILRFRVLRNGATATMTYSVTPRIDIIQTLPAVTQQAYRFYDETGTAAGSIALAPESTALTAALTGPDGFGHLRIQLQSTNAAAIPATDDWQLQWEKNASGSWTNVGTGAVVGYNSPNLTEGEITGIRLSTGTGSAESSGKASEDGLVDNLGWGANNYIELLYSCRLVAAQLAHGDTLRFRVLRNGATTGMTYTATPTINCVVPAFGQSVRFDSSADLYTGPALGSQSAWTFCLWFRPAAGSGSPISWDDGGVNFSYLYYNGTQIRWENQTGSTTITSPTVATGEWAFAAVSYSATTKTLYLAKQGATSFATQALANTTNIAAAAPLRIGQLGSAAVAFNGRVAAVGIWTAALTEAELLAERQNNRSAVRTANLWAFYSFTQGPSTYDNAEIGGHGLTAVGALTAEPGPPNLDYVTVSITAAVTSTDGRKFIETDRAVAITATVICTDFVPILAELFTDSFDTGIDPVIWSYNVGAVWEAGRVKLPSTVGYTDLGTGRILKITGSSVFAKVTTPSPGTGTRDAYFYVTVPGTSVGFTWFNNELRGYTTSPYTFIGTPVTYSPTDHAYWRIRESGGTFFLDTAPDGVTWTNLSSVTHSVPDPVSVGIGFGQSGAESAADGYFDDVNIPGEALATLVQEGFRWRNDDGSETTATWKAAQDTNTSLLVDTPVRLRVLLDTDGDPASAAYTLYYKKTTDSTWLAVPVGSGGGSPVYIAPSSNITASGQDTTAQLTPPAGKSTARFSVGRMWDDENGTDTVDI